MPSIVHPSGPFDKFLNLVAKPDLRFINEYQGVHKARKNDYVHELIKLSTRAFYEEKGKRVESWRTDYS